jgi:hypothetical protein
MVLGHMLSRLFLGLILGAIIGGIVGAAVVFGLHLTFAGDAFWLAYVFAAVTGILAGLVAGKPIWSQSGKIEAGLKAGIGAVVSLGLMFALRKWVNLSVDLSAANIGSALIGDIPLLALPAVGAVLGGFFEADNDSSDDGEKAPPAKVRVKANKDEASELDEEAEVPAKKQQKRK